MCTAQPSQPAYEPIVQRQAYKQAANVAQAAPSATITPGRRSQGNISVGSSILDAGGSGGLQLAGGDQKIMPDLGSKSSLGGSLDIAEPVGSLARSGQYGAGGARTNSARKTKDFRPEISAPWLAVMQAR